MTRPGDSRYQYWYGLLRIPHVKYRVHHDYARGGDFAHQEQAQDYQVPVPERSSDHQSIDRLGPSKPYELLTVCSLVKQCPMEVQPQLWPIRGQMTALFLSVLARYPLALLYTI